MHEDRTVRRKRRVRPRWRSVSRTFLADERGLETLEYAIMIGLITAGALSALTAIGLWVVQRYTFAQTAMGA